MEQKKSHKALFLVAGAALIVLGIVLKRVFHMPPVAVLISHGTAFVLVMIGLGKE